MLPAGSELPPTPLSLCHGLHEAHGPRGKGRYLLSRYVGKALHYDGGSDPWELALAGLCGMPPEVPQVLTIFCMLKGNVCLTRVVVQTMLAHCDAEGKTPLHTACRAELDPPHKKKSLLSSLMTKDTTGMIEIIKVLVGTSPECCNCRDLDARVPLHFLCSNPTITSAILLKIMKMKAFQSAATACDAVGRLPLHSLTLNPALARTKSRHVVSMLRYLILCLAFSFGKFCCASTSSFVYIIIAERNLHIHIPWGSHIS